MNFTRSVRAVAGASGSGHVDWDAVADAAKASTTPGSLALDEDERAGYAEDARAARDRLREASGVSFNPPSTVTVLNRHHWIDRNVETFARVMAPLEDREVRGIGSGVARTVNTGSMSVALGVLSRKVLGQYDPLLLAEDDDHALYVVHPNVGRTAAELDVDRDRFRRWITFHEMAHAAEFAAAPWLTDHLEARMEGAIDSLAGGRFDREALRELDEAMTAVEGYAELLMDRAFDAAYDDLREKVERRRRGGGPVAWLLRRLLGLGLKRRQYERGRAFFETVADERGLEAASAVWERPDNLPTGDELDHPQRWLDRVDPSTDGTASRST